MSVATVPAHGQAAFQFGAGLVVTFALQEMQQFGIGGAGQLSREFIEPREPRQQTGLGIRLGHSFHRRLQGDECLQQLFLDLTHGCDIDSGHAASNQADSHTPRLTAPHPIPILRAVNSAKQISEPAKSFLGIDGGGTKTVVLSVNQDGQVIRRLESGPANVRLLTDAQLVAHLHGVARAMPRPLAVGIGLAGAWAESDAQRIRQAAAKAWPNLPCHATNDLETALLAATVGAATTDQNPRTAIRARVLIVSGTGSCAFGKREPGEGLKVGGWGHMLGDKGSGYQIGLRALQAVVEEYDRNGQWPALGAQLLGALLLNEPGELISWAQSAAKTDIAALAAPVFAAWKRKDKLAAGVVEHALAALAENALTSANRIARRREPVEFVLAGGVLLKQPIFAKKLAAMIREQRPGALITLLECESAWGAVEFARRLQTSVTASATETPAPLLPAIRSRQMSPTEQRNPSSMRLDKLSVASAVRLMINEDTRIPPALLAERRAIEQAVRLVVKAFLRGGRLFYVGAGTSGRLGALDASECPVTFRTRPEMVQGIIAGGQTALWLSAEGAEDDAPAGERALAFRGVGARDVVVGIAASGTTRFVWGALQAARACGAKTVLLAFNPFIEIPRSLRPDVCILPNLGPEILTGSTRLKAGTATKLVLNMLTTLAMVRLGKVASNLMVDVEPTNVKLRDRATRIVQALTKIDYETALAALQACDWVIKKAVARLSRK